MDLYICLYCGDTLETTDQQIKRFGKPSCCEEKMIKINRNRVYKIITSLEKIKDSLEKETIKGIL